MNVDKLVLELEHAKEVLKDLDYKKGVTIIGSARTSETNPDFLKAYRLGAKLAKEGYNVITGGGPGIMKAANMGAFDHGGISVGCNMDLPFENETFDHMTHKIDFNYFFSRKTMMYSYSEYIIAFPGGFGTMDELFEALTLMQTGKISKHPIYLVNTMYWRKMINFVREQMVPNDLISVKDLDLLVTIDDINDINLN